MRKTNVHLEEVTMAARRGIVLAVGASSLALAGMLLAGLPLLIALLGAAALLAFGSASAGFGLVPISPSVRPQRSAVGGGSVARIRVPQVR